MFLSSPKISTKLWRIVAAVGLLLLTSGVALAGDGTPSMRPNGSNSVGDFTPPELAYVPNQLVVKFVSGATPDGFFDDGSVALLRQQQTHGGAFLLDVQPGIDFLDLAMDFDSMSAIEYAHPNYLVNRLHPVQGSYPFSDEQMVGDYSSQSAAVMLALDNSHQSATGAGITVAVLDGGVDASYPELTEVVQSGWDYVSNDGDPFDEGGGQISGHGTFVAGVVHLAAPDAQIIPYRVIDNAGYGDGFTLALAIERAVDDGCNVINISLVLMEEHLAVRDAIDYAEAQGVVVVAAAGNESNTNDLYPAVYENVISVAAIDSTMVLADFASYGASVDICAPGTMVYSTYKDGLYAWWSGSSFAAPFVAGQVAMLREVSPSSSNFFLQYAITVTGVDIDDVNPDATGLIGGGLTDPPASLSAIDTLVFAGMSPDTLYVEVFESQIFIPPLIQSVFLSSSNAPAAFYGEMVSDGEVLTLLIDSAGTTNDSIRIGIETYHLSPGLYYDDYEFHVAGVSGAIALTVCANVVASDTSAGAWIFPASRYFQATVGTDETQYGSVMLWSSNAPAAFTAETTPGAQFTTVLTPSGTTNDSVSVSVNPGNMTEPGTYFDTVLCHVEGVQDPVEIQIQLDIIPFYETAWVVRDTGAYIVVVEGATTPVTGWLGVNSTNAPANYTVEFLHSAVFSSLPTTEGTTNDNFYFEVDPTGFAAGVYFDTLLIYVDGVYNNPVGGIVTLIVQQSGSSTGDTLSLTPDFVEFTVAEGSTTPVTVSSWLSSPGPSIDFIGWMDTVSTLWMTLVDHEGTTDDSVSVIVNPTGFTAGSYYGHAYFSSPDADNTVHLLIKMNVDTVGGDPDGAWATPNQFFVNAPQGSTTPIEQTVELYSSNAPAGYIGYCMNASGLDFVSLPDSAGMTDDVVTIVADPTGLAMGSHADTVLFWVNGIDDPVLVVVNLAIGGADSASVWLQNFPNPFNPVTEISFSLPVAAKVTIDIYNVLGQRVTTLVDRSLPAGEHSATWDGSAASSGVYFYRITAGEFTATKKMMLVK